jgi:hypothetical protein
MPLPAPAFNDEKHHLRLYQGDYLELLGPLKFIWPLPRCVHHSENMHLIPFNAIGNNKWCATNDQLAGSRNTAVPACQRVSAKKVGAFPDFIRSAGGGHAILAGNVLIRAGKLFPGRSSPPHAHRKCYFARLILATSLFISACGTKSPASAALRPFSISLM